MAFRFRVIHKGIILVLLPLAVQTTFISILRHQLDVAESQRLAQEASKKILHQVSLLMVDFSKMYEALMVFMQGPNEGRMKRLVREQDVCINRINSVTDLMKREGGDPVAARRLELLSENFLKEGHIVMKSFIEQADSPMSLITSFGQNKTYRKACAKLVDELLSISNKEEKRTDAAYATEAKSKDAIDVLVQIAFLMNALVALGLMLFFTRDIVGNLKTVRENAELLPKGLPLKDPLKGSDEVADVDRMVHDAAMRLKEAARKENEMVKQIKVSEARLDSLIKSLPVSLITISSEGRVEAANPSAQQMFGLAEEELIGMRSNSLFAGIVGDISARKVLPELVAKTRGKPLETEIPVGGGELVPVELSLTEFESEAGTGYVAMLKDISERKKLELLKQDFYQMVSHDIRSPLTSVTASIDMTLQGVLGAVTEKMSKSLSAARRACNRLLHMVNSLLEIEKLQSGSIVLNLKSVHMDELLQNTVGALEKLGSARGVSIETVAAEGEIMADEDLIQRVLENLISNAVKYSPDNEKVLVECVLKGRNVVVSVTDRGKGVPVELREKIFEKFKQVADSDRKTGFGLGLAICKSIVESHGGKIGVESAQPQGSRFYIELESAAGEPV